MSRTVFSIVSQGYATATGYEALPFIPAELIARKSKTKAKAFDRGGYAEKETVSISGFPLRRYKGGVYYFMPVSFEHEGKSWDFDDAVVSVSAKKTIIETPLVGRKGTVKELISIDDYEIKLVAVISGDDYPEQEIQEIVRLFEINESLVMKCAVTNYFLKDEDRVVIKNMEIPPVEGVEDMQVITMTLVSDQNFELEIR
ncbi:MAG: DUF6046 domain-containing protein [Candidatus Auribacterota bacterium]|jgi:hypothetical protein|nr:DUF6046 domain-containing protein [Candidatus Auribacterota bacterium]